MRSSLSVDELIEANQRAEQALRKAVLRYLGLLGELYVVELRNVIQENTELRFSVPRLQVLLPRMQQEGLLESTLRDSPRRTMKRRYYRLRGSP